MDLGEIVTAERMETAIKELDIAEAENKRLVARVKELQFDCAERSKVISDLNDRIKRLAMRTPSWPKGFHPQGRKYDNRRDHR